MILDIAVTILLVLYVIADICMLAKAKHIDGVDCISYVMLAITLATAIGCIWF